MKNLLNTIEEKVSNILDKNSIGGTIKLKIMSDIKDMKFELLGDKYDKVLENIGKELEFVTTQCKSLELATDDLYELLDAEQTVTEAAFNHLVDMELLPVDFRTTAFENKEDGPITNNAELNQKVKDALEEDGEDYHQPIDAAEEAYFDEYENDVGIPEQDFSVPEAFEKSLNDEPLEDFEKLEDEEDIAAIKKAEEENIWISNAELTETLGFDLLENGEPKKALTVDDFNIVDKLGPDDAGEFLNK